MGKLMLNNINYSGGGGGSGNANYTELTQAEYDALTPKEQMNGTIYFITNGSGGGGGGTGERYSETSLWSGSDSATMQLSESFENYDAIMIIATASTQQGNYRLTNIWSVDYLKNHINDGVRFGLTGDAWYIYFSITDSTTFTRQDQNITYISEIKGLKFGEGGNSESINYSTDEQDTGIKWIDGKTIYQKTFNFSDGDYQLQRNSWTAISSVSIPTLENVVDIRMIGYDTANNKYPAVEDGCSKRFINGVLNYYLDKDFPIYLRAVTVQYTKSTT